MIPVALYLASGESLYAGAAFPLAVVGGFVALAASMAIALAKSRSIPGISDDGDGLCAICLRRRWDLPDCLRVVVRCGEPECVRKYLCPTDDA
jgi:hypothetical protein